MKEDKSLINKLVENIKKTGAPIVVGLDPMLNYVPEHVQNMEKHWKELLRQSGSSIRRS